jgi:hypothetical protein
MDISSNIEKRHYLKLYDITSNYTTLLYNTMFPQWWSMDYCLFFYFYVKS